MQRSHLPKLLYVRDMSRWLMPATHVHQLCTVAQPRPTRNSWVTREARRAFFDGMAQTLGIQSPEDWRGKSEEVRRKGGRGLLKRYPSFHDALQDVYPSVDWSFLLTKGARGYWGRAENRRAFMDEVAAAHGASKPEDWQRIGSRDVKAMGGGALMERYPTLFDALRDIYPEHEWDERTCRKQLPRGYWAKEENQRAFMDKVKARFGIKEQHEWRRVGHKELGEEGGGAMMEHFATIYDLLVTVYPEEEWDERICRPNVRREYWNDSKTRRRFMDAVAEAHNVTEPGDWANVSIEDFIRMRGSGLLARYASVYSALEDIYPETDWSSHKCRQHLPFGYWSDERKVRRVLQEVRRDFHLQAPEDWYRVSQEQIFSVQNGRSLLTHMRLVDALRLVYPKDKWDEDRLAMRVKKAEQRWMAVQAGQLYPDAPLVEDVRLADVIDDPRAHGLELDVFLEKHNLALEFQGRHHYEEMPFFGPLEMYQRRDRQKMELCEEFGVNLVYVPYWWDRQLDSLAATIHEAAPSLLRAAKPADATV